MSFNPCVIIPVYNHARAVGEVVHRLLHHGVPLVAVNDGSTDASGAILAGIAAVHPLLTVMQRSENGGKGAAILAGIAAARARGHTHALVIDADGQHDDGMVPELFRLAAAHPDALVLARPEFGADAPLVRRWGRELSNLFVWIMTGSRKVRDTLCGFRVYPLAGCEGVFTMVRTRRMEFDIELVVRFCRAGYGVVSVPSAVRYPLDGISHFRYLRDNLLIVRMMLNLTFESLIRMPLLRSPRAVR